MVSRGEHTAFNNISNDTRQTSIDILAYILVNFVIKITDLNALLSRVFYSHLAFQRDPKLLSDSVSLFKFPLIRVKATCILDFEVILLETKKRDIKSMPNAPIPPQNHSTGLSAPFQFNSEPNSSPQPKLQNSGFLLYLRVNRNVT